MTTQKAAWNGSGVKCSVQIVSCASVRATSLSRSQAPKLMSIVPSAMGKDARTASTAAGLKFLVRAWCIQRYYEEWVMTLKHIVVLPSVQE